MYRTHTNSELRINHTNQTITLCGWVQKIRDKGFMIWIDLRDRYGITQLILNEERTNKTLLEKARTLGREFVIQITGTVLEREAKNSNIPTGDIEILISELTILNASRTPPFTIDNETDGGEELRMKYRYLDIRRNPVKENLIFRHKVVQKIRNYLSEDSFIEVETPYLIKSTPEGARDFVVPSRMNEGEFYALPQSPQTFKQLLMIGGIDKYFQIVKCFRDEDLRADRQPEFTQLDLEMAFVTQQDVLNLIEGLTSNLLKELHGIETGPFPIITYEEAIKTYGNDKPDIRFDMKFTELNELIKGSGFKVFEEAELVVAIATPRCANYSRKQTDKLIKWVQQPQIGASGLIWAKYNEDGSFKSSVDKFYDETALKQWAKATNAKPGDLILVLSGQTNKVRTQMSALRMHMAEILDLRKPNKFAPLWVVDFPLLEFDEENQRFHAMHHPFTSPKEEDLHLLEINPEKVRANAYDLVLNGNEIGGGSIRIHNKEMQEKMLALLGFSKEEAKAQFGFLMDAFEFGAPPHGGYAMGLDRLVAILGGQETIRDFIAFPKNNSGRDIMIDAPASLNDIQLEELSLKLNKIKEI